VRNQEILMHQVRQKEMLKKAQLDEVRVEREKNMRITEDYENEEVMKKEKSKQMNAQLQLSLREQMKMKA
jgi:hypothetical protein